MSEQIDISYWEKEKITEVAQKLTEKFSDSPEWGWEVEHNKSDAHESLTCWTITGKSNEHKLEIMMYLGVVPWITRWKLQFTMNGREYICLEEMFQKVPALKELELKLDTIAHAIKDREEEAEKSKRRRESKKYKEEQECEANKLISNLRKR